MGRRQVTPPVGRPEGSTPTAPAPKPAGGGPWLLIVAVGMLSLLIVAVVVVLALRDSPDSATSPGSGRTGSERGPTGPAGQLSEEMAAAGMTCVPVRTDPLLGSCVAPPENPHGEVLWRFQGDQLIKFKLYTKVRSADGRKTQHDRLVAIAHRAGLDDHAVRSIEGGVERARHEAKKSGAGVSSVDLDLDWGQVEVLSIGALHSYTILGTRGGSDPRPVDIAPIATMNADTRAALRGAGLDCTAQAEQQLTSCENGAARVELDAAQDEDAYYLHLRNTGRAGEGNEPPPFDPDLLATVGGVLTPEAKAAVWSMVTEHADEHFFLGARDGYRVWVSGPSVMVDAVSW